MVRKRVYICGPISRGDLAWNVNQATAAFLALAKAGLAPFCPHWSVYSGEAMVRPGTGAVYALASATPNELQHADWMGIDLPWVAVSNALLRLPGESAGADREVAEAHRLGIPVFRSAEEVIRWEAGNKARLAALRGKDAAIYPTAS